MSHAASTAVFRHSASKGSARLVLLAMADEAHSSGALTAYARSYSHLSRKANVDVATVRKAIRQLEDLGELRVIRQGTGRESSDYQIVLPGLDNEGRPDAYPEMADDLPRVGHPPTQGRPDATPIIPFSPGSSRSHPSSPSFDAFYEVYPRHTGKAAAKKAWDAAVRKVDPATIIEGAQRYRDDPNRDPSFTAHPATWLNHGRWEDDPMPPRSNGNGSVGARTVAALQAMQQRRLGPPPGARIEGQPLPHGASEYRLPAMELRNGDTLTIQHSVELLD